MPFIIPNETGGVYDSSKQCEPDQGDFDVLGRTGSGTGVLSGCEVSPNNPLSMTVVVSPGFIRTNNSLPIAIGGGTVPLQTADATHPRFDLICVDTTTGGLVAPTSGDGKGAPAENPVFPPIGSNRVLLAVVFVPAGATQITGQRIIDKRISVPQMYMAGLSRSSSYVHNDNPVSFTTVDFDFPSGFANLNSNQLVVPVTGVYAVSAGIVYSSSSKIMTRVLVNGAPRQVSSLVEGEGSMAGVLLLTINDILTLSSGGGGITITAARLAAARLH